jgi:F-type H+-transporting ATPase subunit b
MNMMMGLFIAAEDGGHHDIDPARSQSWIWPEQAELIYGSIASILIFAALFKFAGPAIKQAMADRTNRIQTELDQSAEAKTTAESEAAQIRQAAGDIDAERQRLFAEADVQAAQVLADGRARLDDEVAELEARATADISTASGRVGDELRAEITRFANAATERVLAGGVDDATQNELIESFISKVGAS